MCLAENRRRTNLLFAPGVQRGEKADFYQKIFPYYGPGF
jgi:hypothetical protein